MVTHATALTLPKLKTAIVRSLLVVTPDTIVTEAIVQMTSVQSHGNAIRPTNSQSDDSLEARSSCVVVVEDNQVVGILTERDVVRLSAQQQPLDRLAMRQVMTQPVVTLRESAFADLFFVVNLLQHHQIRHLPILDQQDRLVGLVTHESLCRISRSLNLLRLRQVAEVTTQEVVCAAPHSSMLTIAQLMAEHCVSSVMIMKLDGRPRRPRQIPVGILTERDLVQSQALGLNLESCLAETVMKTPIYEITPEASLLQAQQIMDQRLVRHLAVTGQPGELLGIVTQTNVLQALNPSNLYQMAEILAEKVVHLEAENVALLKDHTLEIEQQVEARMKRSATFAAAPVGIFRTDAAGNYTYLNDRWFKITGLPPLVSMDEGWQQALHAEDRSRVITEWHQAVQEGRPFELEYRFQHPDGRVVWVYGQAVAERDEVGTVVSYVGTLTDISDRKRWEEALKNSESHQRALISAIPDLIMRINRAGIYLEFVASPNFHVVGNLLEITGSHVSDSLPFETAQKRLKFIQLALETNSIQLYEQDLSIDGRTQIEEVRIVPYNDDEVLALVRDISDRKRSEEALKNSEAHQRALISAIPDLIMRMNRDGIHLEFVASPNFHVIGNLPEITGSHVSASIPPDMAQKRVEFIQLALETNSIQIYEQNFLIEGRMQFEEVRIVPYSEDEVLALVRDISDRKQAELALQQSEAKSRAVLLAIPDLMFRVRADGVYCGYVTSHRDFGVLAPEIDPTGQAMTDMLPAELAERQLHYLQKALQTGELQVYEHQIQVGDRIQHEEVRVIQSGEDEVLFMIRDISDRKQAEAALRCLVESTASVTGKDFFSTLAQQLMLTLKVQHVLVTKLVGEHLQTLAYWKDGVPQPEITFALVASPCSQIAIEQGQFYCPKELQQRFSDYPLIQSFHAESYLGIPIKSTHGQPLGNLCILDNKPMENIQWAEAFLRIFALRAAAELERQQATEALEQLNQELEARVEQRTIALRTSEANLSTIFNQAAVGMNLATLDGQYVKVNQKMCDILGYTQEELLTKNFKDLFHPEDIDTGRAERQKLYDGAIDSFCVEMRYRHKNGSPVWLNITVSLMCRRSGEPDYSIAVVKEIGDHKRAEEALRQSEEKFRQLAEHIQSVFWMSSADGSEIIYVSPAYEAIWGCSCESLYAAPQSFTDSIHPKDQTRVLAALKKKEEYDEEYRIIQPSGALCWIRDRAFAIYNAEGEIYRFVGIAEDITARKQVEKTLNRQLALIEASIDGIIIFNSNGECTYLNEAHVKLFGYDCAEELLGKHWQTLCSPSELSRVKQDIFPRLIETRAWRGEAIAIRRDGSTFDNEVSLTLTPTGEVICVCRDISDRRQAEQALQQSEEQFRTVFDYAPVAISLARVDNHQIFRVNAAHYQLFGYSDAELATMSLTDFAAPDDVDQQTEHVKQMVRGEIPGFQMEKRFIKKNGEVILTNMTIALVKDQKGCPLYSMAMMEDITERRQAELEILRNRDLREAIFNESTDAIFLVNVEPSITLDCNRRAVELFEASAKDELLQIAGHTLQRHQFTGEELELIAQEMADKGVWSCELEYITRKGNSFWGNLSAKQVSVAGRVMNLVHVTDISERKQSELLLKAQQNFLRRLIDTVPNLIFVKDWQGRFTLVNQATANLYQSTIEDLVGKTDADFNPNLEEVEQFLAADREVMTTLTIKVLEETVTSPNGKQSYFQTIKTPIMSACGESREILGVAADISDRRQMEEQLRKSEAYLLEAQRIAHVGSWECDMATRKITWSAEMFRIFGRDIAQQEPAFEELTQYIHPDDRDYCTAILRQTFEQGQPFELEHRTLQADGAVKYVLAKGQPIFEQTGGKLLSFLGTVLDITDRKQAEEQLRQTNEQLARTTRLKDEFLANMSHELRTPLNAILGMTEGLQDQAFGTVNERQVKALQTIERSGSHLLELINDILDIAKVEAGQLELDITPTAVMLLCQSSLTFVKQQALKKRIQLEIKLPPNLPDLLVDGRRIRQVLINLLNNAVKFTPDGGRITLQVSHHKPSAPLESADSPLQTFLRIAVIDTGIGIAPEHVSKLFQPFIQIDSALNRQYQGTGLGLALVKRIVELHGGQVGLTSEVGVGSCFMIDLPCVVVPFSPELKPQLEPMTAPSQLAEASPLILLVEDNEANIITVSSYLRAKGYQILLAKSGQEAITLAQSKRPNLILMDIQMPGMDGLEAMQRIRRDPTLVNVPIIALTALAMTSDRERCLAAGATDYFSKPISLKQLVTTIQQLLTLP